MIGSLHGKVTWKQPPELLLEVNGVGYELQASMNTFYNLPQDADAGVTVYTHFVVREDAQTLFGFCSLEERGLFRLLLKVNGIGPKMALAVVSGMTAAEFARFVQAGDVAALSRIPGVGKKTAERMIVEMRDRLTGLDTGSVTGTAGHQSNPAIISIPQSALDEATHALAALGYKPVQISRMLAPLENSDLSVEEMIRQALRASLG